MNWYTTSGWLAPQHERLQQLQDEQRLVVATLHVTTDARRKHELAQRRDRLEAAIKYLQVTVIADDDTQTDFNG